MIQERWWPETRAGVATQWIECSPSVNTAVGWIPAPHKTGCGVHTCHPSTSEAKAGRLEVLSRPQLHNEFKASLSKKRPGGG